MLPRGDDTVSEKKEIVKSAQLTGIADYKHTHLHLGLVSMHLNVHIVISSNSMQAFHMFYLRTALAYSTFILIGDIYKISDYTRQLQCSIFV